MSRPIAAVLVAVPCPAWASACPAAEGVACAAAQAAVGQGIALAQGIAAQCDTAVEIGITLADDAAQRQLNDAWRGADRPTNVLAFPAWEPGTALPEGAPVLLGDVVLAFETIAREAAEQGKPVADHLSHLVVHGVLHLLGYNHASDAEAVAMEALETSILASLGVPDPYRGTI